MSTSLFLKGTNVRFDSRTRQRVQKLADRFKVKKADLIRNALYEALPRWENEGVKLAAPEDADE